MVRKKLAGAIIALSALQADFAAALGLGEMTLKSALNQPLQGQIKLLNVGDLDENQIIVQLASNEDFARAGIDKDFFLNNIEFDVELDARGNGVIKVRSDEKVVEPYLNFLLEARWPNGRLLREYTVLLDLPTFTESAAPVVESSDDRRSLASATEERAAPEPRREAAPAVREEAPRRTVTRDSGRRPTELPAATGEREYRVQHNDTLWEIAERFRPSTNVSVQQTMVALQRHNPEAFIRGNINLVKSGYVLRLPSEAEVQDVTFDQAVAEVQRHNQAWRTGASVGTDTARGPQLDAAGDRDESDDADGYREEARLSIAGAGDADSGPAGEGGGQGAEALRNQLTQAQENLDRAKRENNELESRLDDMERQIATLQRLIALKDDQLAALQGQAADGTGAEAAAADATAPDAGADDLTAEQDAVAETGAEGAPAADADEPVDFNYVEEQETDQAVAAADGAPAAAEQPASPRPAPQPAAQPEPQPGLMAQILNNPLYLGVAGAVVVLLGALAVMLRRRKAQQEEEEAALADLEAGDETLAGLSLTGGAEETEQDGELDELEALDEEAEPLDELGELEEQPEAETASSQPVKSETGDAIAEADIYIAYGRYQQAVDLLTSAIESEPERSDLRVKLIEVYLETGDKSGFQQQYQALQERGDDAAIAQVKEMMSTVDGVSDWLDGLPAAAMAGSAAEAYEPEPEEFAEGSENDLTQETAAVQLDDELDLGAETETATGEFDAVDFDLPEADEEQATGEQEALGDIDLELEQDESQNDSGEIELDLDLDDLNTGAFDSTDLEQAATGDNELGDFELELEGDTGEEPAAEAKPEEEGKPEATEAETEFDLNLDAEPAPEPEEAAQPAEPESDTGAGLDLDLGGDEEFDLELDKLDTGADLGDFELDIEGENQPAAEPPAGESPEAPQAPAAEQPAEPEAQTVSEPEPAVAPEPEPEAAVEPEPTPEPEPAPEPEQSAASAAGGNAEELESDDFDFLADADEVATKLDLARAYIDMGDTDGAKDILDEVVQEGTDEQRQEAQGLIERI